MEDNKGLWRAVLGELEVTVSRANFSTWFQHTAILSNEDGNVVIGVPNIFTKNWLEKKYHDDITKALTKVDRQPKKIEYKIKSVELKAPAARTEVAAAQATLPTAPVVETNLNARYTFDTFVVGASNELAYAACQAVARHPGAKYNPLFLYGGVGLGKTHLMQAVGNEIHRHDPSKRVEYLTSESFTNEFISSISRKKTGSFADKYRAVDVLIIDDMQFLAGKEKTQDEFFHTFNALHQANKQIIISSDRPPQLLTPLEERLRSRFAWGMVADIQPPDLETRAAILQRKAQAQGMSIDQEVTNYLAQRSHSNIRELEGTLTQLFAFCELRSITPTMDAATALMGNVVTAKSQLRQLSTRTVIERTASYFNVTPVEITGARRDKEIVLPRQVSMYLMRHDLGLSFPKIAAAVGGRDHTTAMHSVAKIDRLVETDKVLQGDIQAVRDRLQTA